MSNKEAVTTIALYRPHPGKESEFHALLQIHIPTLREANLLTDHSGYVLQAEDGTIIEVFAWVSKEAIQIANDTPHIKAIWNKMKPLVEVKQLADLAESNVDFPNFSMLVLNK